MRNVDRDRQGEFEPEAITIGGQPASIRWRRSVRATRVALKIDPQGGDIVITLPPRSSRRAGLALLRGHEAWVAERLAALPAPLVIAAGVMIPIGGELHKIVHDPLLRGGAQIEEGVIRVAGRPEFLARRVRDALRNIAHQRFSTLANAKVRQIGIRLGHIRIKDTKSRWGSCAANGTLMFSWRLVMAPAFVQDYVIAHEVAHLRHMNHSQAFWTLADRLTRHRAAATAWLAINGAGLLRIS